MNVYIYNGETEEIERLNDRDREKDGTRETKIEEVRKETPAGREAERERHSGGLQPFETVI